MGTTPGRSKKGYAHGHPSVKKVSYNKKTSLLSLPAGVSVIYAEAQLGELLAKIPKRGNEYSSMGGTIPTRPPPGIDKKISHEAGTRLFR